MNYGLSNRVQIKLIRLARTISDMRSQRFISDEAIEEALALRKLESEVVNLPREARRKSTSGVYHVMLRGANRQEIFHDDEDNMKFLDIMKKYKRHSKFVLKHRDGSRVSFENRNILVEGYRCLEIFYQYY